MKPTLLNLGVERNRKGAKYKGKIHQLYCRKRPSIYNGENTIKEKEKATHNKISASFKRGQVKHKALHIQLLLPCRCQLWLWPHFAHRQLDGSRWGPSFYMGFRIFTGICLHAAEEVSGAIFLLIVLSCRIEYRINSHFYTCGLLSCTPFHSFIFPVLVDIGVLYAALQMIKVNIVNPIIILCWKLDLYFYRLHNPASHPFWNLS